MSKATVLGATVGSRRVEGYSLHKDGGDGRSRQGEGRGRRAVRGARGSLGRGCWVLGRAPSRDSIGPAGRQAWCA